MGVLRPAVRPFPSDFITDDECKVIIRNFSKQEYNKVGIRWMVIRTTNYSIYNNYYNIQFQYYIHAIVILYRRHTL